MTAAPELRYGIWGLVRSTFGAHGHPEEPAQTSWPRLRDQVLEAERLGFHSTLLAHHTRSAGRRGENLDAWTVAAALASITERIELIAAIKPYVYHPVFLAKMALQIEEISQGRFAINFVNAHDKDEIENAGLVFPEHDERYAVGREWLGIVRDMWERDIDKIEGKYYSIHDYALYPRGQFRPRPRIYMGGESDAGRAVVNELADTWFLNAVTEDVAAANIAEIKTRRRKGEPLRFGLPAFVIMAETDAEAKQKFADLLDLANGDGSARRVAGGSAGSGDRVLEAMAGSRRRTSLGSRGGTNAGLIGSYDTIANKLVGFNELGIELFMLSFQPFEQEMRVFAGEVMPRVARLRGEAA